jgi:hypothetical protein
MEKSTSTDFVNYYFENLESYTNDLQEYFSGQQDQLESVNQLNSDSVDILCDDLTDYISDDIDMALSSYDAAEIENALNEGASEIDGMLTAYSSYAIPAFIVFLISISLLIAYFAFERHLRK